MRASVKEVIEILNRVEDKNVPLIFRTKFIKEADIEEDYLDSSHPNTTVIEYNEPKQAVLKLLPVDRE